MSKPISRTALGKWDKDLRDCYNFEYTNDKAVKASCKLCNRHFNYLYSRFGGQSRALTDALNFAENGTTYLLKPNLYKHLKTETHKAAYEKEHGKPYSAPNQGTLSQSFSSVNDEAIKNCMKLMRTAYQIGV